MTVVEEIQKLKQEKNAVILAHYYVRPEVLVSSIGGNGLTLAIRN